MSRRCFNGGALAATMLLAAPYGAIAMAVDASQADGLIQQRDDGKVYIYSGAGHQSLYSDYDILAEMMAQLECGAGDIVIDRGNNPVQLPALLGQCTNHLSFASPATIAAAIMRLVGERQKPRGSVSYVIETCVSQATRQMIRSLPDEGIIVAVGPRG